MAVGGLDRMPNLGTYISTVTDSKMTRIAYEGEAPMMQDMLGGRLQFCFTSALNAKHHIEPRRINTLGVTGKSRMQVLTNVPTIHERSSRNLKGWTVTHEVDTGG